jgi:hypothetical protein
MPAYPYTDYPSMEMAWLSSAMTSSTFVDSSESSADVGSSYGMRRFHGQCTSDDYALLLAEDFLY